MTDTGAFTVLILGLGGSGLSMARWCARQGARVMVADTREAPPGLPALREELPDARFIHGAFDAALIEGQDVRRVLLSPGLSPAQTAPVAAAARAIGLPVEGELALFSQALDELRAIRGYTPQVLAVTGTNGKTTVTSLTGVLVERAGRTVAVAGNIGPCLMDTLASRLAAESLPEIWVLELSSFQLDGVIGFEPTAAVVLNLTQDHLDWHGSMAAYARAKAHIFGAMSTRVLNRDDPAVMEMWPPPPAKGKTSPDVVSFGQHLPTRPGDWGIETVNGMAWLVRAHPQDETRAARGRSRKTGGVDEDLFIQRLMPAEAMRIRGGHNAVNALAALALATVAGCPLAPMLHGLREYRGEPHRVESVALVREVEYFDDSKGTNVGATVAALDGLGVERRLVVILGGDGKGQDFAPLVEPVRRHARAVLLIGRDAGAIEAVLLRSGVPLLRAATMEDAVRECAQRAQPGDAVLLSPACASLDMFRNYGHRAEVFRAAVAELAHGEGVA